MCGCSALGSHVQSSGFRPEMLRQSWQRSQASGGLDLRTQAPELSREAFSLALDRAGRLRHAARAMMQRAAGLFDGGDTMVLICDPEGVVIEAGGAAPVLRRAERNNLQPGGCWNENSIGTNAIGTALHLRQPVTILQDEHFCPAIRHWACAAVPLRDPADGALLGVVDISGRPGAAFGGAGALATTLGWQIEATLREADHNRHRTLIELALSLPACAAQDARVLLDRFGHRVWASPGLARTLQASKLSEDALTRLAEQRDGCSDVLAGRLRVALPGADVDLLTSATGEPAGLVLTLPAAGATVRQTDRRPAAPALTAAVSKGERSEDETLSLGQIAAASPVLAPLCATARKFHDRGIALCLEGAAGTGKTTLARALHAGVSGALRPFVRLDCATLDSETLRQALNGTAGNAPEGLHLLNRGGTLCLSEPARTPVEAQPMLVQLLERLTRGGSLPVRLIALSTVPLAEAVAQGRLLRELQLRCAGAVICLPGLAERRGEIGALLGYFARQIAPPPARPLRFSAAALRALCAHDWPGNLWEMRDLVRALDAVPPETTDGSARLVELPDLPARICAAAAPGSSRLHEHEKAAVLAAVAEARGNLSRAARTLGIARSTLYLKLGQYGLRR